MGCGLSFAAMRDATMSQDESNLPAELPEFNAREFARRWKDVWQGDVECLEEVGAKQKALIEAAPDSWLRAVVVELSAKELWGFLNPKVKSDYNSQRVEMRQVAMRGFQQTQPIVRHPTVQNRLVSWMEKHREVAHVLLLLWGEGKSEIMRALDEGADEAALLRTLKKQGPLASWLGATTLGSVRLFEEIESLLSRPDVWLEEAVEPPVAAKAEDEGGEPEADSEAAQFWKERAGQLQGVIEVRDREIKLLNEENRELETLRERLRASQREVEKARKEAKARETAWGKKLELAQAASQKQLGEVKKHDERETRRLNASEKEREELDSTVKVLRKQVRHLNQLLDEQKQKATALETRLAQREEGKAPKDDKAVEAISTPQTTQQTANAPVKVAKPTPLDELFRWVADGHEFRVTPRETMRHIDRGDADFAFRTQLALEGVGPQDVAKKNAFLTRLKGQDGYYVRVLTEPTQRALVDASNVVRATKNRYGKGELRNLLTMKAELRRLGFFPIEMIADASLRYNVDEINAYNEMINRGEVEVVAPGTEADELLARKARNGGGYVVTNDAKFHFKVSPDLAPPSIAFRVVAGTVVVDEF